MVVVQMQKDIQLPRSSLSSDVGKDWVDFRAGSLQLGGRYYRRRPPRALLCNHSTILPFPLANSISYTLDSKGWKKYVRQEALFRCCCCCCSPRNWSPHSFQTIFLSNVSYSVSHGLHCSIRFRPNFFFFFPAILFRQLGGIRQPT